MTANRAADESLVRVAAYFDDDAERQRIEAALRAVRPETVEFYNGMIVGVATRQACADLVASGLAVSVLPGPVTEPTPQAEAAGAEEEDGDNIVVAPDIALAHGGTLGTVQSIAHQTGQLARRASGATIRVLSHIPGLNFLAVADPQLGIDLSTPDGLAVYRVRVTGALTPQQRADLAGRVSSIAAFEGPSTYRVYASPDALDGVRALPFVADVQPYDVGATIEAGLSDVLTQIVDGKAPADLPDTFTLLVQRSDDLPVVKGFLRNIPGVTLVDETDVGLRFRVREDQKALAALLLRLADLPTVRRLSAYEPPRLFNDHARRLIGVAALNAVPVPAGAPAGAPAPPDAERWTGAGELVGVIDSGIDADHPDLAGRIEDRLVGPRGGSVVDLDGHGTHVAGSIVGTGAASGGEVRGIAPGAKLLAIGATKAGGKLDLPDDLGAALALAYDRGARIINLSLGYPPSSNNGQPATSVDRFVYANPECLVVAAVGNFGAAPQGFCAYGSTGEPGRAKNVLTVGASCTDRQDVSHDRWGDLSADRFPLPPTSEQPVAGDPNLPAGFSGRGPSTHFGVKPEVLAPGTYILSLRASQASQVRMQEALAEPRFGGRYVYLSGTSMATPIVAGAAAIVRQYLREALDTPRPSAALVKAILIASARPLPSLRASDDPLYVGQPDFDQGFGVVDLSAVLPHPEAPTGRVLAVEDVATTSDDALGLVSTADDPTNPHRAVRTYLLTVADGAVGPLRIALTWADPPGRGFQNVLGLHVVTPDDAVIFGNGEYVYRVEPRPASPPDGFNWPDANNAQRVVLNDPAPGQYTVRVIARQFEQPEHPYQGYALCVVGELASGLRRRR